MKDLLYVGINLEHIKEMFDKGNGIVRFNEDEFNDYITNTITEQLNICGVEYDYSCCFVCNGWNLIHDLIDDEVIKECDDGTFEVV